MKHILKLSVVVLVIVFQSCQKDMTQASTSQIPYTSSLTTANAAAEVNATMKPLIPSADFNSLDWANAVVSKSNDEEITVTVKNKEGSGNDLLVVLSATTKMYQWNNEVHYIFK